MQKENYIKSELKLSIGILVSNRKQYIRKVMEGIKPLLDQLACELVIVDTKGEETDGSIDIVREYTDKIYPFTWCNDFSAARNFGLQYTTGEWFLFLDDDEWFENVQEIIDFFQSGECENYGMCVFNIRNHSDQEKYTLSVVERMVRRTTDTRFVGRVHERFEGIYGERKHFSCEIIHMGYAHADSVAKKRHQERNLSILLEEVKKEGMHPRMAAQIIQEYISVGDTAQQGIELAEKSLKSWNEEELGTISAQWILTAVARRYRTDGKYEELLAWAEYVRNNFWRSNLTEMVLSATVANGAIEKQDFLLVLENAAEYIKQWDWLQNHEEEKKRWLQLDLPAFMTQEYYALMLYMAGTSAGRLRQYKLAMYYWNRLPWEATGKNKGAYLQELERVLEGIRVEAVRANSSGDYRRAYGYWELLPWNMNGFDGNKYVKDMQETLAGLEKVQ